MEKSEALAALRDGETLTSAGPMTEAYEMVAHLMPKKDTIILMRYFGESEWAREVILTWEELEEWGDNENWWDSLYGAIKHTAKPASREERR